ncbi:hypothetical protein [Rhodococcoides fascians]|uniref:hypothetical protein n=1 Tax=Rhodococcoides fascians TaxID=1828 RepID=UPI00050CBC86|nr:hypothetical protein [Rhodococcus fascians]
MRSLKVLLSVFGFGVGLVATLVIVLFSSVPTRSTYAFVDGSRSQSLNFVEMPGYFVIGIPVICAVLGWLTASVLIKRGCELSRTMK